LGRTNDTNNGDYLYKATLPDAADDDPGFALVYSKSSPKVASNGKSYFGSSAYFLQTTSGELFSVDADNMTFVTSSAGLTLYTYSNDSAGSAEKYSFTTTGIATSSDGPVNLDATMISAEESRTLRDIDNNGAIGAKLDSDGIIDSTGGLYKVEVAGENVYVWGSALDKAKYIDVSTNALLNTDGTFWSPDVATDNLKIVRNVDQNKTVTWDLYLTDDATGDVTKYAFDSARKLKAENGTTVLTATQLAAAEVNAKRDLNADDVFGVDITTEVVTKSGLFKGEVLGQSFYLYNTALKVNSGTATAPNSTSGSLTTEDGGPWEVSDGYSIGGAIVSGNSLSVYVYKDDDKNDVTAYSFTKSGNNWQIADNALGGTAVDAIALAAVEKLNKRDLNADTVYGVNVEGAVDKTGGLYQVSALGNKFLAVGRNVVSSISKPFDLSTALLNSDGTAWAPDDVANVTSGNSPSQITIVPTLDSGVVQNYDVYVHEDGGAFAKYTFGDGGNNLYTLQVDGSGVGRSELSLEDVATAEKLTLRDINGDGAFGLHFGNDAIIDKKGNLYKASFNSSDENNSVETVYVIQNTPPVIGSALAARAVDFTNALYNSDGSDYWNVDDPSGYSVKSAYKDSDVYHVFAVSNDDSTSIQHYQFTQVGSKWQVQTSEETELPYTEPSASDFSEIEDAQNRDLNGDAAVGVKITSSADKVGGLHVGTAFGRDYLVYGATVPQASNLTTALSNADGTAWGTDEDGAFDAQYYNSSTDSLTFKKLSSEKENGALYELYVKRTEDDVASVTQYQFDQNFKLIEDESTGKTLSGIDLAAAEKSVARDLDGDKVIGAKYDSTIDKTGGLHVAKIGGDSYYVYSAGKPDKGMTLADKAFLSDDGETKWSTSGTVVGLVKRSGNQGFYLYSKDTVDGEDVYTRHRFNNDRVFVESEELDAKTFASDEKTYGRDFNGDKAVGVKIDEATDKIGLLFKASILGQSFYVASSSIIKTGTTGSTAVDLTNALFDGEGAAWSPGDEQIAGLARDVDNNFLVYTYTKSGSTVDTVTKHKWNADKVYQESVEADPLELVQLETAAKRDLSGDNLVGFRVLSTVSETGYKGVTEAKLVGDTSYWIVGTAVKQGTKTSPLGKSNALLNEDGTGPWKPENAFIKAVVDSGDSRQVYVTNYNDGEVNAGETAHVLRYSFDKSTGRVSGDDPVEISGVELAKIESSLKKDLDDDGVKGAYYVEKHATAQDLLKVSSVGSDYLVVASAPRNGQIINLENALVTDDAGTAWKPEEGVTLRGAYVNADTGYTEIYGTWDEDDAPNHAAGDVKRYVFANYDINVDDTTTSVLKLVADGEDGSEYNSNALLGSQVALREAAAKKDFDGDSTIGFKATVSSNSNGHVIKQLNGLTFGTATTGTPSFQPIYVVGKNLASMGSTSKSATANNAALLVEPYNGTGDPGDGISPTDAQPKYFQLDAGVEILSLYQNPSSPLTLDLYGKRTDPESGELQGVNTPSAYYIKYSFTRDSESTPWVLDAVDSNTQGTELTPEDLVAAEKTTKRDLNDDTSYGLKIDSAFSSNGSLTVSGDAKKLFRAQIDNLKFYLLGAGLITGTVLKPLGLGTQLLNSDDTAWKPADGTEVTGFKKLSAAEITTEESETGLSGIAYKATIDNGGSDPVYFNSTLKVVA